MFPCPCCGYEVFTQPPGSDDICPICFWEDDIVQLAFPEMAGGANKCSLINGQRNFAAVGACETRFQSQVRKPGPSDVLSNAWRIIDPSRDRLLRWSKREDHERWDSVKNNRPGIVLYYWSPDYWLAGPAI